MPGLVDAEVSAFSHIVSAARSQQQQNTPFYRQNYGVVSVFDCAVVRSRALAIRLGGESVELLGPAVKSLLCLWMLIGGCLGYV